MQSNDIFALSVLAAAALTAHRAVSVVGAVPAAGANVLGFAKSDAIVGARVPVASLGTAIAEAGAAIAAGAALEVDNQGRVITRAAGVTVGRMAPGEVAAAAGDKVEIILIPN